MAGQNPISLNTQSPTKALVPQQADSATALANAGGVLVAGISGNNSVLNITTATVVKASPGRSIRLVVQVAGSGTGTVSDCATTGAVAAANQVAVIPQTVGPVVLEWPHAVGIVVTPGTGQTVAIAYS